MADLSTHSDMHSICSVVKQFLRELPESLITEEVFQAFLKGRVCLANTGNPNMANANMGQFAVSAANANYGMQLEEFLD